MKTLNYTAFLIVIMALAMGCKVSKDIPVPLNATPAAFRGSVASDSSSIAILPVKAFIQEPDIQQLIDTALLRNYDLQLAVKNIETAELLFKQARLGNIPVVNLQLSASSNRPSDNSLNGLSSSQFLGTKHIEDYTASLGLSWEADIWGKIKNQQKSAMIAYLQTAEARKALQTRIVANVAQGFYQLLMMDAQMEVARRNLKLNDSTLRIIKMQFDVGQVTSLAIQQAEAQQLVAAQLIPELEQAITIQENALSILTGKVPAAIERQSSLERIKIPVELASGYPAAMVSARPDVQIAELALNMANAEVGIAKANLYPTLSITASGGLNSLKASNWFNVPASLFGVVAGGITLPLFQRKQLKTEYEVSKIDREKVVIQFRQAVLNATGEVSDELVKIQKLQEQYAISLKRVETLQQAVKNSNLLFKNGMATYLEVITAQSNSLQSELALAAVKTSQLIAAVELYRALGGGVNKL
ncbi:TolC family protein [Pedobacter sp.]|uniref:TolC family protein n=1 Tax=Pedobacter sp. TaxID=1411316 RepID=UPI003D7F5A65